MSLTIYSYYTNRDLLYKIHRTNIYENLRINHCIVSKKIINKVYLSLSSFILLFDKMSYINRIKKTNDKKLINAFVNISLKLTKKEFINFLLSLKLVGNFNFLLTDENVTQSNYVFKLNSNMFEEFVFFYKKYLQFFDIFFTISFINCKNQKEKYLLLNNLNNIV